MQLIQISAYTMNIVDADDYQLTPQIEDKSTVTLLPKCLPSFSLMNPISRVARKRQIKFCEKTGGESTSRVDLTISIY